MLNIHWGEYDGVFDIQGNSSKKYKEINAIEYP